MGIRINWVPPRLNEVCLREANELAQLTCILGESDADSLNTLRKYRGLQLKSPHQLPWYSSEYWLHILSMEWTLRSTNTFLDCGWYVISSVCHCFCCDQKGTQSFQYQRSCVFLFKTVRLQWILNYPRIISFKNMYLKALKTG